MNPFSSRLDWDLPPNRLSRALAAKRAAGAPLLDLTESNPTRAGFDYPPAILDAFRDERALRYDPAPAGLASARAAVAGDFAERGFDVGPGRILLTASTSEAYAYLFKLLADPGDEVLAPRPSYPLFEFLARLESVSIVQYPLLYDHGWTIDFARLEEVWTPRARAVVIVNPNNPTGSFLKRGEGERLEDFCAARNLALISDEVFSCYAFRPDPERVESLAGARRALAFCLGGLSKSCGLPQVKLGWIVAAGPDGLRRAACERLELIADTFLSAGTPAQCALPVLLKAGAAVRAQIARRTAANLSALRGALGRTSPLRLLEAEGGWYATLQAPRVRPEEDWVLTLLEEDNVLVQPGYFFDFEQEAYLVVSLLARPAAFEEGIRRLVRRAAVLA